MSLARGYKSNACVNLIPVLVALAFNAVEADRELMHVSTEKKNVLKTCLHASNLNIKTAY